jgi:cell division protein FtsQ
VYYWKQGIKEDVNMMMGEIRKGSPWTFSRKRILKLICFGFFIFVFSCLLNHFKSAEYFPIHKVKIVGVSHIDHDEVKRLLLPLVHKGFFGIDVESIKEQLIQFAWVADASVRRVWPNEIDISVKEKMPVARWNQTSLISNTGEIFTPPLKTCPKELPQFVGPEGGQLMMLEYYAKIKNVLMPLHYKIARLELTPGQSWRVTFNNGMKLNVGYKDVLTRINHFVKVYPRIVGERANDVDYVDLRYANGLAVRWKTVT